MKSLDDDPEFEAILAGGNQGIDSQGSVLDVFFSGEEKQTWSAVKGTLQNVKRYDNEFEQLQLLGTGEFGEVYKCRNRIE